ncbi:MAG: hypothetical protein LBB54_03235 [Cellulomonadaceae bacterium]|nr:hypothetical protein [Cellulomonadaceae bacterium]
MTRRHSPSLRPSAFPRQQAPRPAARLNSTPGLPGAGSPLRRRLRRYWWRSRWAVVAVSLGIAAAATVHTLAPPPPADPTLTCTDASSSGLSQQRTIDAAPAGSVVVPIMLDPSFAAYLSPGDHIDLLANSEYVARRAQVLPAPTQAADSKQPGQSTGGLLGSVGARDAPASTLVAVSREESRAVSAAMLQGTLAAVIVR